MHFVLQPVVRKQHNTGYKHKVCFHTRVMRCWGRVSCFYDLLACPCRALGCTDRKLHSQ